MLIPRNDRFGQIGLNPIPQAISLGTPSLGALGGFEARALGGVAQGLGQATNISLRIGRNLKQSRERNDMIELTTAYRAQKRGIMQELSNLTGKDAHGLQDRYAKDTTKAYEALLKTGDYSNTVRNQFSLVRSNDALADLNRLNRVEVTAQRRENDAVLKLGVNDAIHQIGENPMDFDMVKKSHEQMGYLLEATDMLPQERALSLAVAMEQSVLGALERLQFDPDNLDNTRAFFTEFGDIIQDPGRREQIRDDLENRSIIQQAETWAELTRGQSVREREAAINETISPEDRSVYFDALLDSVHQEGQIQARIDYEDTRERTNAFLAILGDVENGGRMAAQQYLDALPTDVKGRWLHDGTGVRLQGLLKTGGITAGDRVAEGMFQDAKFTAMGSKNTSEFLLAIAEFEAKVTDGFIDNRFAEMLRNKHGLKGTGVSARGELGSGMGSYTQKEANTEIQKQVSRMVKALPKYERNENAAEREWEITVLTQDILAGWTEELLSAEKGDRPPPEPVQLLRLIQRATTSTGKGKKMTLVGLERENFIEVWRTINAETGFFKKQLTNKNAELEQTVEAFSDIEQTAGPTFGRSRNAEEELSINRGMLLDLRGRFSDKVFATVLESLSLKDEGITQNRVLLQAIGRLAVVLNINEPLGTKAVDIQKQLEDAVSGFSEQIREAKAIRSIIEEAGLDEDAEATVFEALLDTPELRSLVNAYRSRAEFSDTNLADFKALQPINLVFSELYKDEDGFGRSLAKSFMEAFGTVREDSIQSLNEGRDTRSIKERARAGRIGPALTSAGKTVGQSFNELLLPRDDE